MKTKLLKKIRKQYSIVYYPYKKYYEIDYPEKGLMSSWGYYLDEKFSDTHRTLQGAKDSILNLVKMKYYKYSKKYKLEQIKQKVWHV